MVEVKTKAGNSLKRDLKHININILKKTIIITYEEWLDDADGDQIGERLVKEYRVITDQYDKWDGLLGAQIRGAVDITLANEDIEAYLYPPIELEE